MQSATWRTNGQKWLDSIDKQIRRSNLKEHRDRRTDRRRYRQTSRYGRLDYAPSANVVAMATRVGPPGRPKHIRSYVTRYSCWTQPNTQELSLAVLQANSDRFRLLSKLFSHIFCCSDISSPIDCVFFLKAGWYVLTEPAWLISSWKL